MARVSLGKKKIRKPPTSFYLAPAVEAIAEDLIVEHHKHLRVHNCRIEYIFRSDTPKKSGKSVYGTMRIVGSLNAFFGREKGDEFDDGRVKRFFAMVISRPAWDCLDAKARIALVDHELCHAGADYDGDGNTKLTLIPHDLEEFRSVVDRHGFWDHGLKLFAKSVQERIDFQE